MSETSPVYSFLPWARQGLSKLVTGPVSGPRATIAVELEISATPRGGGTAVKRKVSKNIALYGPGDIVGIESRAIIRTEPRDWTTDFEPNYLPCVEFYEEDFPWRYTPAAPTDGGTRLAPWIALIVLSEDEFDDSPKGAKQPLPSVLASKIEAFPPASQTWGFAHVHVNSALSGGVRQPDAAIAATALADTVAGNRDRAYSRLLSPRRLLPNTAYHAFVMPAFESGRLAGLGLDPKGAPSAGHCSWEDYPGRANAQGSIFPYYHRWYFRTGGAGDFESLVRRLRPQRADARIGRRDMDVSRAGAGLTGPLPSPPSETLKLGGALQAPRKFLPDDVRAGIEADDKWFDPFPHPLQRELAKVLNRPDDLRGGGAGPDPIIAPPIYGAWHARQHRLLLDRSGTETITQPQWLHDLNLDPRFRAPAGIGARIIQKGQEDYMSAAWRQIGEAVHAVKKIRLGWMAMVVSQSWKARRLDRVLASDPGRHLAMVEPMKRRLVVDGVTLLARLPASTTPAALFSAPFRRLLRPNGRIARMAGFARGASPLAGLATRVEKGELKPAPDKILPPGAISTGGIVDAAGNSGRLLSIGIGFILLILLLLLLAGWLVALAAAAALAGAFYALIRPRLLVSSLLSPAGQTRQSVDSIRTSSDFAIGEIGGPAPSLGAGPDNAEATRFKSGLSDAYAVMEAYRATRRQPSATPLSLSAAAASAAAQIDPRLTIPRAIRAELKIPERISGGLVYEFDEPMGYPRIDDAMYEPLSEKGELFVPNLALLPPDAVTLLETQQAFIEAYMAGLNTEFGRELLWREYPTDQRGSSFRQFWDVRTYLDPDPPDPDAQREKYYDISKLHLWHRTKPLGSNDNRQEPGSMPREEAVLAVRGQLLKRYPTTLVYAQAAEWQIQGGAPRKDRERLLARLSDEERKKPPREKVRTPLYGAKVKPDIHFFGFDLTAEEAMGDPSADNKPGWFFVFEERPGEPRFGADYERTGNLAVWNDLAWTDIAPADAPFIPVGAAAANLALAPLTDAERAEKEEQRKEDDFIRWGPSADAGAIAYMLFQAPSRVAFHARELLTGKPA